ncbi:unnamed protein product [Owenia fusiformis]|uniref:Uncharacterized protein n=1 Tax=Owenia fusiformis TaxID=6347 RepID=A0A8J1TRF4_OWEFU|nr:unnamed protein product [Owenia fusiformis]
MASLYALDMSQLKGVAIFWLKKTVTKVMMNDFNKNGVWDMEDCRKSAEKMIKIGNLKGAKAEEVYTYWENMPPYFNTATNLTDWIIGEIDFRNDPNSPPIVSEYLEKWFSILDSDRDDAIDLNGYKVFWDAYGLDPDYLKRQFDYIDADKDGIISRQDFVKAGIDFCYNTEENANIFWGPIKDLKMV